MPTHPFLTTFDIDLIRLLTSDFLLLSGKQISTLFPDRSPRNIRYRLHRLALQGFISSRLFPAHYNVPKLPLYFAGPKAPEALSIESSDAFLKHRKRAIYMKDRAIPHFLLIQSAYGKLLSETRQSTVCQLTSWIHPYDPLWNTFQDYGLQFRPDAYGEIRIHTLTVPFFLEIDTGEERGAPLKHKFDKYNEYALSGNFQHHFSLPKFRLLFITTSPRRIRELLRITTPHLSHVFWFATFEDFLQKSLLESYWSVAGSDALHALSTPL